MLRKASDAPGHETVALVLSLQSLGRFANELLCYPSLWKLAIIIRQVYPMSYVILKALVVVVVAVVVVVPLLWCWLLALVVVAVVVGGRWWVMVVLVMVILRRLLLRSPKSYLPLADLRWFPTRFLMLVGVPKIPTSQNTFRFWSLELEFRILDLGLVWSAVFIGLHQKGTFGILQLFLFGYTKTFQTFFRSGKPSGYRNQAGHNQEASVASDIHWALGFSGILLGSGPGCGSLWS